MILHKCRCGHTSYDHVGYGLGACIVSPCVAPLTPADEPQLSKCMKMDPIEEWAPRADRLSKEQRVERAKENAAKDTQQ